MANLKSSKKKANQDIKRRQVNLARKTSLKTAVKKVLDALANKQDRDTVTALFKDAEAKLRRAQNKGALHINTVSRKVSRLAKRISTTFSA